MVSALIQNAIISLIVTSITYSIAFLLSYLNKNKLITNEVSRKVVHIGGGTLYLALYFYNDNGYLSKYLNIFPYALWTVILLWKSQQKSFDNRQHDLVIDIMTRHRHQYELIRGPLFFNFVIIICGTVLYRTVLGSMIMAILTWGDGLAAVIGMRYGYKRKIYGSKSLDGFLTVFIVGIIASVTYISLVVGFQSVQILKTSLICFIAAIAELFSSSDYDNLTISLSIAVAYFFIF